LLSIRITLKKPIYFDYAATTPVHPQVIEAMMPYFSEEFGNAGSSQHYFGWMADEAVELARKKITSYFGCSPRQLVFTSGATESNNLAIQGFLHAKKPGHIISSSLEHKAVLQVCEKMERQGWAVTYLNPNSSGLISLSEIEAAIRPDTVLVSLMLVNNETGNLLDFQSVAQLCHSKGIFFHSDATQALGKIDLSNQEYLPDLLSFSGHKMYGPKGIGGLLINSNIGISPLVFGGGQERGLRPGTLPVQQIVGFSTSFSKVPLAIDSIAKLKSFQGKILNGFKFPYVLNSNDLASVPHIINISIPGWYWEELYRKIPRIAVSNGSACNAKSQLPSHVMKAMGHSDSLALATLRISLSYLTTEEEVDFLISYLNEQLLDL
jgi:cysteine desulfurase